MSSGVPQWLRDAQSRTTHPSPSVWDHAGSLVLPAPFQRPTDLHAGVWLIEAMDLSAGGEDCRALVGVVIGETEAWISGTPSVLVAMVSADVHMATDNDVILKRAETGLPYEVMVRTDLVAPVFVGQIGARLGLVAEEAMAHVVLGIKEGPVAVPIGRRGRQVIEEDDPRVATKDHDATMLRHRAEACMAWILRPEVVVTTSEDAASDGRILVQAQQLGGSLVRAKDVHLPVSPDLPMDIANGLHDSLALKWATSGEWGSGPSEPTDENPENANESAIPEEIRRATDAAGWLAIRYLCAGAQTGEDLEIWRLEVSPSRFAQVAVDYVH